MSINVQQVGWDEIARTKHHIGQNLIIGHTNMANGDTQAQDLLELELDGRTDISNFVGKILSMRDRGGEFAG